VGSVSRFTRRIFERRRQRRAVRRARRRYVDPVAVERIRRDLSRWRRTAPVRVELSPLVALAELAAWLGDAGRCTRAPRHDWESLLVDVMRAWEAVGVATQAAMPQTQSALQQLRAAQTGTQSTSHGIDAATASLIWTSVHLLRGEVARQGVVSAAITDVLGAANSDQNVEPLRANDDLRWQLSILHDFAEEHGHDWELVAGRIHGALGGEHTGPGLPAQDVAKVLEAAPERGHSVVWVAIDHAYAWGLTGLEPSVQFFDPDWLLAVLKDAPREQLVGRGVPAELTGDPQRRLRRQRQPSNRRLGCCSTLSGQHSSVSIPLEGPAATPWSPKRLNAVFQARNALRAFDSRTVPSQTRSCRKRSSLSFTRAPNLPLYRSGQRFFGERGKPPTASGIKWSSSWWPRVLSLKP
jgi:hypothetical protein